MTRKPTISIFTAITGHASIAESINQTLKPHYHTYVNDITHKSFKYYFPFYLYFPQLFKIPYQLSDLKQANNLISKYSEKTLGDNVRNILTKQKPDVVISTWYLANPILEKQQKHDNYQFINIITDPRTFHGLIPSKTGNNLVFDELAKQRCLEIGVPESNITISGWFVRQRYQQPYNINQVHQQLQLDPDVLTLLVSAGSIGTNFILKIIPAFINCPQKVNVIVACGKNKRLLSLMQNVHKINTSYRKTAANVIPLPFTDKLYRYMQAADLVVGKAGPNLIFESAATKTPFFAITHISGQEDGNLDIIKDYQLGYVEENPVKANQLLGDILKDSSQLSIFKPSLTKIAKHNAKSADILLKVIDH